MASLLESYVRKQVAKGFKGQLIRGVLLREIPGSGSASDEGDPWGSSWGEGDDNAWGSSWGFDSTPTTYETYNFEGIRDNFNAGFAAQAGIPRTDVRILIILGLITPVTTPLVDDMLRIRGDDGTQKWHKVRAKLTVDPANAHIVLQCFEIATPEGAP